MAEALKVNTTVTGIGFNGECRAAAAAAARRRDRQLILETVFVDNEIEADGARAIAEALKVNRTVTNVDLSRTCWSGDGEDA